MSRAKLAVEYRLMQHRSVDPITNCWLWTGGKLLNGYGQIKVNGKTITVHRVSASIYLGLDLWNSMELACHKDDVCKNKLCFNPEHLYVGNHFSNNQDVAKLITHCPQGHHYDEENTYLDTNGTRRCLACELSKRKKVAENATC